MTIPNVIEKKFKYKGYSCVIVMITIMPGMQNRCGYVKIPKNHKFFEKDYDDISIDCHYGLTYGGLSKEAGFPSGWHIGFDCAHGGDTMEEWTQERVEKEIENIVDQL